MDHKSIPPSTHSNKQKTKHRSFQHKKEFIRTIEIDFQKSHLSVASTFGSISRGLLYCILKKISINACNYFHSHRFVVTAQKNSQNKTTIEFYLNCSFYLVIQFQISRPFSKSFIILWIRNQSF